MELVYFKTGKGTALLPFANKEFNFSISIKVNYQDGKLNIVKCDSWLEEL